MADVITRLKVESSEYDQKIKRATQSLNEMTTAAEKEGNRIATANKENIALAQSLGKMATVSTTAKGKMGELTSAIEAATIQYNRLTAAEKQGQFGRALNSSISQLQTRLAGLKTEMAAVQGQMGKTSMMGGMGGGFGAGLKGGLAMMGPQAMGFAAVAGAAMGVKKVFSDLIGINKQFEQSHANLAAVMGKTRDETAALATQAKQLGATTQYTAMQILDLQTNLARLGFTEQEILNSTKAVQALATATNADLGEAANLAGAALRGFGLDASEMDRVASVLAVSTSKSALSFDKLATAIPIVAPVAKQFGFSIEDTVTMIGKLSDAGMDASMAATATRNIFLKMADGSGKLSQAMGRPVHSVEEFGEALKEMKEKGMSLNDILKMVGVRSTAAFAVFADNADTLGKFKGEITNCGDQLDKMVAEQLNTLEGSLKILNSAWEGLMLTFSNSNGILKKVTDKLAELLQAWSNWRNREKGGEAAINTYTNDMTEKDKRGAREKIDAMIKNGSTAKGIEAGTTKYIAELKKKEEELLKLQEKAERALHASVGSEDGWWTKSGQAIIAEMSKVTGIDEGHKNSTDLGKMVTELQKKIASNRDQQQRQQYNLDYVQSILNPTTNTDDKKGLGDSDLNAKKKAQIEATAKAEIAALDKVQMIKEGKEEEYEDRVYAIRKSALEQIAQLYSDDTKEYAQVQAQKSQLDIQYQNTKLRLLKKTEREEKKAYTGYGDTSTKSVAARIQTSKTRLSEMEIGSTGYMIEANKLVDLETFQNLLNVALKNGLSTENLMDKLVGFDGIDLGFDISNDEWQSIVDEINTKLKELNIDPIKLNVQTGEVKSAASDVKKAAKDTAGAWQNATSAVNNVGDALQQIEDPAAKVAGIVMQAVANIALGFAQAAASPATTATGIFGWIAAATAGLATMVSTIAAVKSATGYASGGMVEGSSYSGDNIVARLNSGEGVLTAQGVQNAAAMAAGSNPMSNMRLSTEIDGKKLRIVLNNDNRAEGGDRNFYSKIH